MSLAQTYERIIAKYFIAGQTFTRISSGLLTTFENKLAAALHKIYVRLRLVPDG
jgi:hypothetical protein